MSHNPQPDSVDSLEKAMFVLLGWLLALATSPIVEAIKRRREIKETKAAILAELAELKYRMAIIAYKIESEYGSITKDFLLWLQPLIKGYSGPMAADSVAKVIEMKLAFTDEQLQSLVNPTSRESGTGLSLKRYPVPFLASRLQSIAWLPGDIQRLLLEIHTQVGILDAEAENVQHYFRMTFDSGLTGDNRERVDGNLANGYRSYGRVAKYIADRISQLEAAWTK